MEGGVYKETYTESPRKRLTLCKGMRAVVKEKIMMDWLCPAK